MNTPYVKPRVGRPPIPLGDRVLRFVAAGPNGCWIWTGQVNNRGYGYLQVGSRSTERKSMLAHRVSYEQFVGAIPEGLTIDHLCRTPLCIRPDHLEAVTHQVNILRAPGAMATRWASRTHCNSGHEFTADNTEIVSRRDNPEKTYRRCRACRRNRKAAVR